MLAIRRRFICFLAGAQPYYYSENSISHQPLSYFCLFLCKVSQVGGFCRVGERENTLLPRSIYGQNASFCHTN
jgi:hypothetical protein